MGRNKKKSEGSSSASWMVTFSDLATLLLTFFVLLLSMSSLDDLKLKSSFHNFTASSGILEFKEYGEIYKPRELLIEGLYQKLKDSLIVQKDLEPVREDNPSDVTENPFKTAKGTLTFQNIDGGFKLVFGEGILFDSGSAEIKEEAKPLLEEIVRFMRVSRYQIYVDGHTDNVPIHNELYPSNEELSLARAYNLINYFVHDEQLPSEYMSLTGYGESRPVAKNDSETGRKKNRRVELIFKNQKYF